MAIVPTSAVVPEAIGVLWRRLLGRAYRSSRAVNLGRLSIPWRYRLARGRRLPASSVLPPGLVGVGAPVVVPLFGTPNFEFSVAEESWPEWLGTWYDNEYEFPGDFAFPEVAFRPWRNSGIADALRALGALVPVFGMHISGGNPRRPEGNRRRFDTKVFGADEWRRVLQLVNRSYGSFSELAEVNAAFQLNPGNPAAIVAALAINQAVDVAYGVRARELRNRLYSSAYWRLPVGYDTLRSVFSGRLPFPGVN